MAVSSQEALIFTFDLLGMEPSLNLRLSHRVLMRLSNGQRNRRSCLGDFINHEIRIPIQQPGFDSWFQSAFPRLLRCGVGTFVGRTSVTRKRCWILKMLLLWKTMEAPNRSIHGEKKNLRVNFFWEFPLHEKPWPGWPGWPVSWGSRSLQFAQKNDPRKIWSGEFTLSSHFCPVDSRAGFHIPNSTYPKFTWKIRWKIGGCRDVSIGSGSSY